MNREHIINLISKEMRMDNRKLDQYREVKIEYGVSSKSAEGSARVIIGKTEVVAGIKLEVGEPYPDAPDDGTIIVSAELLPLASPQFESGPPGIDAIELSRVVDRAIRESKTLDFKKLCVKKGEKMWMIFIDIYPINDDGNLFDASFLAALAALKDAKFPKYDKKEDKVIYELTKEKLPLSKKFPISCTIAKINGKYVVDPTSEEEEAIDARLTVATLENGNVCALQKGGDYSLDIEDIDKMVDLAIKKGKELRKLF